MARLIWSIGQYDQSNNAISPFQYSASIGSDTFETKKSHYKSGKFQNTQSQICYLYLLKFNNRNNLFAQLGLITISPYLYCLFAVWNIYNLIIIK